MGAQFAKSANKKAYKLTLTPSKCLRKDATDKYAVDRYIICRYNRRKIPYII